MKLVYVFNEIMLWLRLTDIEPSILIRRKF